MRKIAIFLFINIFSFSSYLSLAQTKNTVLDVRDGKIYKTIVVGNKTWMAENLNYRTRNSWCYDNKDENCEKFGRMYDWNTAMNGSSEEKATGLCPSGWHIASYEEWMTLVEEYKKTKDLITDGISGFELTFAGCRFPNGNFEFIDMAATYWTSTLDPDNDKYVFTFYAYSDKKGKPMVSYSTNKTYGQYLRCVKD